MLKWLASLSLCISVLFSADEISFLKRAYESEKFEVSWVKLDKILELKDGFEAQFFEIGLKFIPLDKTIKKREVLFVKDGILAQDIINLKSKTSMRDELLGEKISVNFRKKGEKNDENCN